jgi:sigma-B regulation protein RsbU (phosphoserine phosphatase)
MRALIADDNRVEAAILSKTLQRLEIEATVVHDGADAWEKLIEDDGPSLAILDWMMPKVDGLELCRRIRQAPARAHMYLILLTGRTNKADIVAGLEAGADDYIVKPFAPDELRARVLVGTRVLGLQEKLAERVSELEAALSRVKRLHGLLPICSYCKRIRGDDQYWRQVDAYIVEHTDAKFTHGICPPCSQDLLAEIEEERQRRERNGH